MVCMCKHYLKSKCVMLQKLKRESNVNTMLENIALQRLFLFQSIVQSSYNIYGYHLNRAEESWKDLSKCT